MLLQVVNKLEQGLRTHAACETFWCVVAESQALTKEARAAEIFALSSKSYMMSTCLFLGKLANFTFNCQNISSISGMGTVGTEREKSLRFLNTGVAL